MGEVKSPHLFKDETMKEIERFTRLHEEYEKQKKRILILLEADCKRIGLTKVSRNLGCSYVYLYNMFNGTDPVSHDKLMQIWNFVQEQKLLVGIEDEKESN